MHGCVHYLAGGLIIAYLPKKIKEEIIIMKKEVVAMKNEEERRALITAMLPLLEKMPLAWLRATYITVQKRANRQAADSKEV